MHGEGWRKLGDESIFDVMQDMADRYDDCPVGIAVIAIPSEDTPTVYGGAFSGIPALTLAKAQDSMYVRAQLAILAVCTAQAHGREVLADEESYE